MVNDISAYYINGCLTDTLNADTNLRCRASDGVTAAQPTFEAGRRTRLSIAMGQITPFFLRIAVRFAENSSFLAWSDTSALRRRFTSEVGERIRCRPASAVKFDVRSRR